MSARNAAAPAARPLAPEEELTVTRQSARLRGAVVTTPFSYVATTSSLAWENCEPALDALRTSGRR